MTRAGFFLGHATQDLNQKQGGAHLIIPVLNSLIGQVDASPMIFLGQTDSGRTVPRIRMHGFIAVIGGHQ